MKNFGLLLARRTMVAGAVMLAATSLMISCGGGSGTQANAKKAQQEIVVELPVAKGAKFDTIHIGNMNEGEIYSGSFMVHNKGAEPVVISDIKVECGCTKTEFEPSPIMVGESRKVNFTFNSEHRPGRQKKAMNVKLSNGGAFRINFDAVVAHKDRKHNKNK